MQKTFNTKKFLSQNSIWLVLIVLVIIMSIAQPSFFSVDNLLTLLSGEAVKGIMAFGVMFAILSKGIDLTIGASAALVACITASLVQPEGYANAILPGVGTLPAPLVILIGLALGAGIGAIYGAIIAYTKIPPFMFAISAFLLTQTRFGKNVYAIGGNDQAARVAGINVEKNLILVYIWCSLCAAIAGMLLAGRAGSADPANSGLNYELDAIAAATVGGTSHTGGICRVSGVLAGILILGVINNGLVMLKVDDNMTNIVKGVIIVGSVVLDMRKNAKRA